MLLLRYQFGRAAGIASEGTSLTSPIAVIADWAEFNVGRIVAAQERYDTAPQR